MDNKTIRHFGKNTLNEFLEELKERVVDKIHNIETIMPKKLSDLENDLEMVASWNDLKDKPFGEEVKPEMIIDSYEHTFKAVFDGKHVDYYEALYINGQDCADTFIDGEELCLVWNNAEYTGVVETNEYDVQAVDFYRNDGAKVVRINLPKGKNTDFMVTNCDIGMSSPAELPVIFSLYRKITEIKTLDEKFLPDHTHSWDDLTNKPFDRYIDEQYENVFKSIYFGGEWIINLDSLSNIVKENNVYNVTLLGESYNVVSEFNGTYLPAVAGYVESLMWIGNPSLIDANTELHLGSTNNLDLPFVIYWYGGEKDFSRITPKIITNIDIGNREELIVKQSMGEQLVYVQMEDGYLPDNIPKIQSATVGQTIVVKEVDENGKPTEWEAADVASSGAPIINGTVYFGSDTEKTIDKTYDEIMSMINANVFPVIKATITDNREDNEYVTGDIVLLQFVGVLNNNIIFHSRRGVTQYLEFQVRENHTVS